MFRERTFRFSWAVLAPFMIVAVLLGIRVIDGIKNPNEFGRYDGRQDIGIVIALVLICLALRFLFVVHVGPDGLRTTDGIGRYHDVRWDAMQRVRNVAGFLWLPHGVPGKALCFPIFLDDAGAFREYVLAHAPEGNPLRAYLSRA